MDEEKTCSCNDECCERDEPQLGGVAGEALTYAPDYQGSTISFNDASGQLGVNHSNRIHDMVIKEMDLGYLVKVGCQTLCLETKERLIDLFTAYLNNPQLTMDRYYKDKFQKTPEPIRIAVVGYSQEDIDNHIKHNLLPVKGFTKKAYVYRGEINGEAYELYAVSKETHLCGIMLDKVIETHRARENKNFGKIIENCNAIIKR